MPLSRLPSDGALYFFGLAREISQWRLRGRCVCMQADLLGVMVWWHVQLNAVSLVNLVMVRRPHCDMQLVFA